MSSEDNSAGSSIGKWIVWAIGTTALAILASALYDFAAKNFFIWIGEQLIYIGNLGSAALIDAMYVEVAKGNYERASVLIFVGISGLMASFSMAVAFFKPKSEIDRFSRINRSTILLFIRSAMFVIGLACVVQAARITYIIRAANHLEQLQRIVAPYVPADQRLRIASQVAQIKSKKDYDDVVVTLSGPIKANNLVLPTFDIQ